MKLEDYFKEWYKIIDTVELHKVIGQLKKVDLSTLCPHPNNIFKAFELCPYNELKVVFLGYDPYSQKMWLLVLCLEINLLLLKIRYHLR